jgi:UDP-N-acetylmuramoylalanine--D-glutamate ligase
VLSDFEGLKHRCEMVAKIDGVECYDSSIDSTPVRTAVTIRSLGRQVILILGGRSKGLDYTALNPVLKEYASSIIITGENAEEIYEAIEDKRKVHITKSFAEATELGLNLARDVGALLLSPASTSYDMFRSYAERGDSFKEILLKLALKEN